MPLAALCCSARPAAARTLGTVCMLLAPCLNARGMQPRPHLAAPRPRVPVFSVLLNPVILSGAASGYNTGEAGACFG